jgi:hypothetical protein
VSGPNCGRRDLDGRPFAAPCSARCVADVAPPHLLNYLGLETEVANLSRDAIETWASSAEAEAAAFDWAGAPRIRAIEEGIAAYMPSETSGVPEKPTTLAWHDHTGVIIPIAGERAEIRVEYVPEPKDEYRVDRLRYRHATPQHAFETILDWRGYFGRNSGILDGWTMMRQSGRGYVASFAGEVGFVVGTVVRRLTTAAVTLEEDPWAKARCVDTEQRYPLVAMECPDLSKVRPPRMNRAMVWVHGPCRGTVGLKDLLCPTWAPASADRRHGVPVRARHLREDAPQRRSFVISSRTPCGRSSRSPGTRAAGVARLAADLLQRTGTARSACTHSVATRGTPPSRSRLRSTLVKVQAHRRRAAPLMAPLTKAVCYTLDSTDLPPGIKDMGKDGEVEALRDLFPPSDGRSWGSDFDLDGKEAGFGPGAWGVLRGALGNAPHDLVVPTALALAFGARQPTLSCSHVRYFRGTDPRRHPPVSDYGPDGTRCIEVVSQPAAATPARRDNVPGATGESSRPKATFKEKETLRWAKPIDLVIPPKLQDGGT